MHGWDRWKYTSEGMERQHKPVIYFSAIPPARNNPQRYTKMCVISPHNSAGMVSLMWCQLSSSLQPSMICSCSCFSLNSAWTVWTQLELFEQLNCFCLNSAWTVWTQLELFELSLNCFRQYCRVRYIRYIRYDTVRTVRYGTYGMIRYKGLRSYHFINLNFWSSNSACPLQHKRA
jgi:hypothetical protein